jgi:hypothetical protein
MVYGNEPGLSALRRLDEMFRELKEQKEHIKAQDERLKAHDEKLQMMAEQIRSMAHACNGYRNIRLRFLSQRGDGICEAKL